MNLEENIISRVADSIVNNPKVAISVPAATAVLGKASALAEIQSWLTVASMAIGILVSVIIAVHWVVKTGNALLERKEIQKRIANMVPHHD